MKRFFEKVVKTSTCWIWTGARRGKQKGYGCLKIQGKVIDAHRFSYIFHFGYFIDGLQVCHKCDNKICVNPSHLFVGTGIDNMQDCKRKGRLNLNREHTRKHPSHAAYKRGCRCQACKEIASHKRRKYYVRPVAH